MARLEPNLPRVRLRDPIPHNECVIIGINLYFFFYEKVEFIPTLDLHSYYLIIKLN